MIKLIGFVLMGVVIGLVFNYVKNKIMTKVTDRMKEQWDVNKFRAGLFRVRDKVSWAKSFYEDFNIRTILIRLAIISAIVASIYGYGWYKGRLDTPIQIALDYEKEFKLKIDSHYLLKPKQSQNLKIVDKEGNLVKQIKVEDFPELQKKLKPYGLCLEPYFSTGIAMTEDGVKQDTGVGVNWLRYFKWRMGNWISNNGVWIGVDYKFTDNFGLGGGIGKGYKGDNLVGIRGQWKF